MSRQLRDVKLTPEFQKSNNHLLRIINIVTQMEILNKGQRSNGTKTAFIWWLLIILLLSRLVPLKGEEWYFTVKTKDGMILASSTI